MADTPEAFLDEFVRAFVDGDTPALKALYHDDARFISPAAGVDAHGRAEIDAAWDALAGAGSVHRFEVLSREVTMAGDYAICHLRAVLHGRWSGSDEDVTIPLRATEVLRRGPNGAWRYFIDHGA
jgi:ketosteroid isomerase-like protein